jgi:hypothetical protein
VEEQIKNSVTVIAEPVFTMHKMGLPIIVFDRLICCCKETGGSWPIYIPYSPERKPFLYTLCICMDLIRFILPINKNTKTWVLIYAAMIMVIK